MKLVPLCELEPEVRERIPLCTCRGLVDAAAIENRLKQEVLHTLSIPSHSTSAYLSLSQHNDSLSILSQPNSFSLSLSLSASRSLSAHRFRLGLMALLKAESKPLSRVLFLKDCLAINCHYSRSAPRLLFDHADSTLLSLLLSPSLSLLLSQP